MSRKQEIENIIIGTLLNTFDIDWFKECSFCITPEMFEDVRNSKIYSSMCNLKKVEPTSCISPYSLYKFDTSLFPLLKHMVELSTSFYFLAKKAQYNKKVWLLRTFRGKDYTYTRVDFKDYMIKFIENYMSYNLK